MPKALQNEFIAYNENQHKFHYRSEKVGRVNCNCFGKDSYHQPSDVLTRLQININIYHFLQALRYYATRLTLCTNFLFNNTSTLPLAFVFWTVGFNVCFWYLITFLKWAFEFQSKSNPWCIREKVFLNMSYVNFYCRKSSLSQH